MTTQPKITKIYIYPIKSCRGIEVNEWPIDDKGLLFDRRWMIVQAKNGVFISQRQHPKMALIEPSITTEGALKLQAPGFIPIDVIQPADVKLITVELWKTKYTGVDMGDDVATWLSSFLGVECRLVKTPDDFHRGLDKTYVNYLDRPENSFNVGYADGFPFHLAAEESLRWLNSVVKPGTALLHIERFRPNFVIDGTLKAFDEDTWKTIQIIPLNSEAGRKPLRMHVVKPCMRCTMPTVDQLTGEREPTAEPLTTLRRLRFARLPTGDNPIFGQNLVHDRIEEIPPEARYIRVGDTIEVLVRQPAPVLLANEATTTEPTLDSKPREHSNTVKYIVVAGVALIGGYLAYRYYDKLKHA